MRRRFARDKEEDGEKTMLKHGDITEAILQSFYKVYNVLGQGFLEKVYERALAIELRKRGLQVVAQAPIAVLYEGEEVGLYYADLLVNGCVIVEVKAVEKLADDHHAQLVNYLRATGIEVGLLPNFGPRPESKRKINELAKSKRTKERAGEPETPLPF
jgi:GxxExxY protein